MPSSNDVYVDTFSSFNYCVLDISQLRLSDTNNLPYLTKKTRVGLSYSNSTDVHETNVHMYAYYAGLAKISLHGDARGKLSHFVPRVCRYHILGLKTLLCETARTPGSYLIRL